MTPRFDGKRIFLTGAAGALGGATARAFAAEGARLFLLDGRAEGLDAVAAETGAAGRAVADVADEAAVTGAVAQAVAVLGGLDIVVNATGVVGPAGPLSACTV